jgi:alginate O-acetyltransferase complex protein AlgI
LIFSSPLFLFVFLPIVLLLYYSAPPRFRNACLFLANMVFYGWGSLAYLIVMLISIGINYAFALAADAHWRRLPGKARTAVIGSVVINLGMLSFFKFSVVPDLPLPAGISFYTFQAMSYVVDVYRGNTQSQRNFITFGTYVSLFPQLIAGPIVRYKDVAGQLADRRRETPARFAEGIRLFLVGLAKKVLLANPMGILWNFFKADPEQNGMLGSWIGITAFTFQIYFDFSGYSDMARGLGKMFGFEFVRNFDYPYIAKSVTEFWRRWHISLSAWFRDYVYIPLGGSRGSRRRTVFNLFAVWSLTGLWHGARSNFILWGVYYFVLLTLEKYLPANPFKRLPGFLSHIYTLFFVMLGWVVFGIEDWHVLSRYLISLFSPGNGNALISGDGLVQTRAYLPLMLASFFACLPAGGRIYGKLGNTKCRRIGEILAALVVLALCTASLISESYNPFLYFRF